MHSVLFSDKYYLFNSFYLKYLHFVLFIYLFIMVHSVLFAILNGNLSYLVASWSCLVFLVLYIQRSNLKNAAQILLVPLKFVFNFSRFKPALIWNRFFGDLRRGLNSDTGLSKMGRGGLQILSYLIWFDFIWNSFVLLIHSAAISDNLVFDCGILSRIVSFRSSKSSFI